MYNSALSEAETVMLETNTGKRQKNPKPPKKPEKRLYDTLGDQLAGQLPGFDLRPILPSSVKSTSSIETDSCKSSIEKPRKTIKTKYKESGVIFTLEDFEAIIALETLVKQHGKVSHMGILDKSYTFFLTKNRDGALYFKVKDKIAIVGGDPLCTPEKRGDVLHEFEQYRKKFRWGIGFLGATEEFVEYAQKRKWTALQFGLERVLNPTNNDILLETSGKRMAAQNRQLLRNGVTLGVYCPHDGRQPGLQEDLVGVYKTWREDRNQRACQAYITVYDPFSLPNIMIFIYGRDRDGKACGFAALRRIVEGYHIDPCIALPDAPRGVTDLLMVSAMALLRKASISYLSLGFEPASELGDIIGMPKALHKITRTVHRRSFAGLPITGKKAYYDKFRPDESQESKLFLVFPSVPSIRHMTAMMHIANISIRSLLFNELKRPAKRIRGTALIARSHIENSGDRSLAMSNQTAKTLRDEL
jgi:lysylphosphatidylglycerol synthetase-like protein (DUF2156 family)